MASPHRPASPLEATSDVVASHEVPPLSGSLTGRQLGEFLVGEYVANGARGMLYQVTNRQTGGRHILKVLTEEPELHDAHIAMEAWIGAQIQHNSIVKINTCNRLPAPDGRYYIIMEYIAGETLRQYLDRTHIVPIKIALYIAKKLATALAFMHRQRFVHRDIKPANIILAEETDGEFVFSPKIIDLGLAQAISRPGESSESFSTPRFQLTGTAKYAAPEQWKYRFVDDRADVYALGAVLYEMLAGRPPFVASSPGELAQQHQADTPSALEGKAPEADAEISAFVLSLLHKDPHERPAMSRVEQTLQRLLARRSWALNLAEEMCPYPGVAPFGMGQAAFYSRSNAQLEPVLARFGPTDDGRCPWLHIEGGTLSGKTSLLHAAVLPAVIAECQKIQEDVAIIHLPISQDPVAALAQVLYSGLLDVTADSATIETRIRRHKEGLAALMGSWYSARPRRRALLVIDSLEQLLDAPPASLRVLDEALAAALRDASRPLYLITVLRSTHNARMRLLPELSAAMLLAQHYVVPPMDKRALATAIRYPAQQIGLLIEESLIDRIVRHTLACPHGLSGFAYVLRELWCRRQGMNLTADAYAQIGKVSTALAQAADAALNPLSTSDRNRARELLVSFVRPGRGEADTVTSFPWAEAVRIAGGGDEGERLLRLLLGSDGRGETRAPGLTLLQARRKSGSSHTVELTTEALLHLWPTLRQWLEEDRPLLERWREVEAEQGAWAATSALPLPSGERLAYLRGAGLSQPHCARLHGLLSPAAQQFLYDARQPEQARELQAQQRADEIATRLENTQQELESIRRRRSGRLSVLAAWLRLAFVFICGGVLGAALLMLAAPRLFGERVLRGTLVRPVVSVASTAVPPAAPTTLPVAPPAPGSSAHPSPPNPGPVAGAPPSAVAVAHPEPLARPLAASAVASPSPAPQTRRVGDREMVVIGEGSVGRGKRSFLIDKYEVSVADYRKCVLANVCKPQISPQTIPDERKRSRCNWLHMAERPDHPMNCVTALDAETYCRWNGQKRLPTDPEWLLAALGQDGRRLPWGNDPPGEQSQICWMSAVDRTCAIGRSLDDISPAGVMDMAGNVAEWTASVEWKKPCDGLRVFRGGNYDTRKPDKLNMGQENRHCTSPYSSRQNTIGIRCVKDLF